jgi:hypothetical protein
MNKEDFNAWLIERIEAQTKLTIGAVVAMVGLGLLALVIQGGFLALILQLSIGWVMAIIVVSAIFGAMGYSVHMTAPKKHCDARHKIDLKAKKTKVRIAPTMANAWTFALGSTDSDQSILERVFGLMLIVPRMFWTAWYLHKRVTEVRDIDVSACSKVLRMALEKAERVEVTEIEEKYESMDIIKTMRQVSLIDGVVFLTKKSIGLSIATRFKDDLEAGLNAGKGTLEKKPSPFDVA